MWTVEIEPRDGEAFPKQLFEHVTAAEGTGGWFLIRTRDGNEVWFSAAVYARVTVVKEKGLGVDGMNDYKRLRKGLEEIASAASAYVSMRDRGTWLGDAVTDAEAILADTSEESEMERLREWLEEHLLTNLENADDYAQGQHVFVKYALDHIQSEFLGGEDAAE